MHSRRRLTGISLVAVAALVASITPVSAATGTTRYVDGDGHASPGNCGGPGHAFRHIQGAVNASGDNDTVIVCPGTYQEQVVIKGDRDGLTLRSSTPFGAIIRTPASLASLPGAPGFTTLVAIQKVDGVTVRGFKTIARSAAPCSLVVATIAAIGSKRTAIRGNRLLAPGTGPTSACAQIYGIFVVDALESASSARSSSATIGFNEVRDTVGIGIGSGGFSREINVDIVHNSVRAYFGDPPAGASSVAALPSGGDFGIGLFGRNQGTVRDNVIQGSSDAPLGGAGWIAGIGILPVESDAGAFSNDPIDVHDNTVRRVFYGIYVVGADDLDIHRNQVTNTLLGLLFSQVKDSTVQRNEVGAKSLGIAVDAQSSHNTVRDNTVGGIGGGCDDASIGTGTAGTANHWSGNIASVPSNPAGICAVVP
jgi:hypothetical protein